MNIEQAKQDSVIRQGTLSQHVSESQERKNLAESAIFVVHGPPKKGEQETNLVK